ncbi:hypothetical protein ACFFKC_05515 [Pseudoduganella danionis]|uniref:Ribosomal protein L7/L12 C-terminal domain-containing protein n=1 Tax=Pseudoduganella danionis TaxID=1890295 RepID=A0ABW9SRS0_9BURK|nr:hypothetical protein [Pseudoduganella danionis]MTW34340.1 hypothetical protein [Pseudoduganella danionis]
MEINFAILAVLAIAFAFILSHRLQEMNKRCRKLEQQLDVLLQHFGLTAPAFPLPSPEVAALITQRDRRIDALRLYRQQTGLGLKEAVEAIDHFEKNPPQTITNNPATSGDAAESAERR